MTRVRWWGRFLRLPLVLFAAGYALALLLTLSTADRMLYHPEFGSRRAPAGLQRIRADDGPDIAVLHLPNPSAHFTIWFFHGNAEDMGDVEPFLRQMHAAGFAVFAYDYPGYGLSAGRPAEQSIYAAARRARAHLRDALGVPASRTLLFGRSLGGGPATQMAIEEHVAGLVLQSAFTSVFRVVTRWGVLPFDRYVNIRKLRCVEAPVLVMHGEQDEVIPFHHGQALFAAAREPKRALWIPYAKHNDFTFAAGDRLWAAWRDFAALCAREEGARSP